MNKIYNSNEYSMKSGKATERTKQMEPILKA